jgi:hypothetical protein
MISLRVIQFLTLAVVIGVICLELSNHPAVVFVGVLLTLIVVNWIFGRVQQHLQRHSPGHQVERTKVSPKAKGSAKVPENSSEG